MISNQSCHFDTVWSLRKLEVSDISSEIGPPHFETPARISGRTPHLETVPRGVSRRAALVLRL
eukprot:2814640-Prymnesium_polylepis.1